MPKKPAEKRAWPLIVRAWGSHVLHISDYNSQYHTCGSISRCGRDLDNTRCVRDLRSEDFLLDDKERKTGWKREFLYDKDLKKEPVLCARCGTVEDFRQAHAGYLQGVADVKAKHEKEEARRMELIGELVQRRNHDLESFEKILPFELNGQPVKYWEDSDPKAPGFFIRQLVVMINGRRYLVTKDYGIDEEVNDLMKAESSK